jgi:hypothetical protein
MELSERKTVVEICLTRTSIQFRFIQRIAEILDSEHRRVIEDTTVVLATKLSLASSKIEGLIATSTENQNTISKFSRIAKRGKYAVVKESLDAVIKDLEEWQRRFDPSWFLIMLIADPFVDVQLQRANADQLAAVTLNSTTTSTARSPLTLADGVRRATRPSSTHQAVFLSGLGHDTAIPFSTAKSKAVHRKASTETEWYVIDTLPCRPGCDVPALEEDVRDLTRKLSRADPFVFGLLSCKGAIRVFDSAHRDITAFDLVFRAPEGMRSLQSLRQALLDSDANAPISISRRVRFAQELAKSVSYVHTFDFVHKSICPESVLIFADFASARNATFLVGFGEFRSAGGGTIMMGDDAWERNIYRHPARQGEHPKDSYKMQHDIYSLGVCLLEIGLWASFVDYGNEDRPLPKYGQLHRDFLAWAKASGVTLEEQPPNVAYLGSTAILVKEYLLKLTGTTLLQRMGEIYAEVVATCLTCLDENNGDFGEEGEFIDSDEVLVGVRFIEKVLGRLNEITV